MRRDIKSSYSKLFLQRNSLKYENVRNYVTNILKAYNIMNYEIKEFNDKGLSLWIFDLDRTFIVYTDEEYIELKLLSSDDSFAEPKLGYVKDTCWKQVIREILKRTFEQTIIK